MEETKILNSKLNTLKLGKRLDNIKQETGMVVQSLLFSKEDFTEETAKAWAKANGFEIKNISITDNFLHIQQKLPSEFNAFRTIIIGDGVKARVAGNMKSKFAGHMTLKNISKFSEIKNDMELKLPMEAELMFLCEGPNRDGGIDREDLEISLESWEGLPIIDWHDMEDMSGSTKHKITDRGGYLKNPKMVRIDGKWWITSSADIISRKLAYHLYLKEKTNKPLEVSPEYGWSPYWKDGKKYQTNIRPHLISIVDNGHIKGNKIKLKIAI